MLHGTRSEVFPLREVVSETYSALTATSYLTLECGHKTSRPHRAGAAPKRCRCDKCAVASPTVTKKGG